MWRRVAVSFAEDPIPKFPTVEDREKEKMRKKLKELKVLFVSRHDACRGPMAECIFHHINEKFAYQPFAKFDWRPASAGMIRFRGGNLPDQLALRVLKENNLETMHGSRQVSENNDLYVVKSNEGRRPCSVAAVVVWIGKWEREIYWLFWVDSTFRFHPIRLYPLHGAMAVSDWRENICAWEPERIVISWNK